MNALEFWHHVEEVFEGMALSGHRRQMRAEALELEDLFLLMCF